MAASDTFQNSEENYLGNCCKPLLQKDSQAGFPDFENTFGWLILITDDFSRLFRV